jgi:excisionase family DNA binding protein
MDHAQTQTAFLTIDAAAARLSVSYGTIRKAIQAGRLPAYCFGTTYRIRSEDLDGFVAACRFAPTPPRSAPSGYRPLANSRNGLDGALSRARLVEQPVYVPARRVGRTARTRPSGDPSDG